MGFVPFTRETHRFFQKAYADNFVGHCAEVLAVSPYDLARALGPSGLALGLRWKTGTGEFIVVSRAIFRNTFIAHA